MSDQSEYEKKQAEFDKELKKIKDDQDKEGQKFVEGIAKDAKNLFELNKPSPDKNDEEEKTQKMEQDLKDMLLEKKKKKGKGEEKEEEKAEKDKQSDSIVDAIVDALKKIFGPKKGEKKDDKDVDLEALKEKSGSREKSEKSEESDKEEQFKDLIIISDKAKTFKVDEDDKALQGAKVLQGTIDLDKGLIAEPSQGADKNDNKSDNRNDIEKLFEDFKQSKGGEQEGFSITALKDTAGNTALKLAFPEAAMAKEFADLANKEGLANEPSSAPKFVPSGTSGSGL